MKIEIEKPVIPQFVADWIDKEKRCTTFHKSFSRAINLIKHDEEWREWEYEVGNRWARSVATAWLYGYEVEQEPLYYAKIKGWELIKREIDNVYWNLQDDDIFISDNSEPDSGEFHTRMTKEKWNYLGIHDLNADFEKAEG